ACSSKNGLLERQGTACSGKGAVGARPAGDKSFSSKRCAREQAVGARPAGDNPSESVQVLRDALRQESCSGDFASQDSRYLLGLHRPADQESLREVALAILEKLELRDGFHALGRDFYIKPTGHG